jgi:hypothetical protein
MFPYRNHKRYHLEYKDKHFPEEKRENQEFVLQGLYVSKKQDIYECQAD